MDKKNNTLLTLRSMEKYCTYECIFKTADIDKTDSSSVVYSLFCVPCAVCLTPAVGFVSIGNKLENPICFFFFFFSHFHWVEASAPQWKITSVDMANTVILRFGSHAIHVWIFVINWLYLYCVLTLNMIFLTFLTCNCQAVLCLSVNDNVCQEFEVSRKTPSLSFSAAHFQWR